MPADTRTVLAFDFGLRRIGVAAGNALLRTAQPLKVLHARDGVPDWEAVAGLVGEWRPDLLLVGDPLNMDGSDSELCARARRFARRLHGRTGVAVELVDERLSSREAREMLRSGEGRRRTALDAMAAQVILQTWLAASAGGG